MIRYDTPSLSVAYFQGLETTLAVSAEGFGAWLMSKDLCSVCGNIGRQDEQSPKIAARPEFNLSPSHWQSLSTLHWSSRVFFDSRAFWMWKMPPLKLPTAESKQLGKWLGALARLPAKKFEAPTDKRQGHWMPLMEPVKRLIR